MASFLTCEYFSGLFFGIFWQVVDWSTAYPLFSLLLGLLLYRLSIHLLSLPRVDSIPERYILVTGCARGFGFDIAKRLDSLGCHVFACCRSERGMRELDMETSDRCHVIRMDISSPDSVREALNYVNSKLPPGQGLWGLVNNAGTGGTKNGPVDWLTLDDYRELIEVNFLGTVDVTMTFLPLIKQARGRIVNISSTLAILVSPFGVNYSVSKISIEAFSDGLRRMLRPYGCKVVVLEPGAFKTDLMSEEFQRELLTRSWDTLPQHIRDNYGQDFIEKYVKALQRSTEFDFGNKVSLVSDAVVEAVFSRRPLARYMVGRDVRYLYSTLAALPEWLGDWIFEKLSAMPKPQDVQLYK